jgi:AcrR family transcriptional regulator
MMVSSRLTAQERRTAVLAAAISEFARSGYAGTSTESIASRAGISQPYLFRLFGTKKELFLATYELVADRMVGAMTRATRGLEGEEAMEAMAEAYLQLMGDPEMLQLQLHGYAAAASDPEIAESCRGTFAALYDLVADRMKVPSEEITKFLAMGMLINVVTAIGLSSLDEPWARDLCPSMEKVQSKRHGEKAGQGSAVPADRDDTTDTDTPVRTVTALRRSDAGNQQEASA